MSSPPPRLRSALLRWYGRHRRDLPWRGTRDPYAVWVSEIMLQQTQVSTVVPYFRRFLRLFPDVRSLAAADEERVLAAWSGLGYYRRARAMQAAAREIVARHDSRLPSDPRALRALPGIGRYTAGAVASIAFGLAEPVLDGNVRRLLSRLFAVDGPRETARLWELAAALVPGPRPGDLNQAMMELGTLICRPRDPDCPACPVASFCEARRTGRVSELPSATRRPATVSVESAVAWIEAGGRLLVERPDEASPLRGTWDLPAVELGRGRSAPRELRDRLARRHGIRVEVGDCLARCTHAIMARRISLRLFRCRIEGDVPRDADGLRWVRPARIDEVAVSGATRKLLRAVRAAKAQRSPRSIGRAARPASSPAQ